VIVRGTTVIGPNGPAKSASELAAFARIEFGSDIGVGVSATIMPVTLGLFEGSIVVAVSDPYPAAETFPIRAAYGEIQRRAAMNAADVLRRALASQ
jgi:hypothetical protein